MDPDSNKPQNLRKRAAAMPFQLLVCPWPVYNEVSCEIHHVRIHADTSPPNRYVLEHS